MADLPDGWFYPEDIKAYRQLVESIPDGGKMLEIGSWKGRSLCSVADIILRKKIDVDVIDTFEGTANEGDAHKEAKDKNLGTVFVDNISKFGLYGKVGINTGRSDNPSFLENYKDKELDLIFIDADHSYEAVKQDIENWLPKCKGIIAGHDYGSWEGVTRAVNEKFIAKEVIGNVWYKDLTQRTVTATVSTKGRYNTTLPLCLMSITQQLHTPDYVWIYDDSDNPLDMRQIPIFKHIFNLFDMNKIKWQVIFGQKKGQVFNHQHALENAPTDYVWRLDDDNYAEPNCLYNLMHEIRRVDNSVGAVAGQIWHTDRPVPRCPSFAKNKMGIGIETTPREWYQIGNVYEDAEHLYSSFLYSREAGLKAGGYSLDSSPACHREETIFTHRIKRAGYKLVQTYRARTYHLKDSQGGIRSYAHNPEYWAQDEAKFSQMLKDWGINNKPDKLIILDNGLGDHYSFKQIYAKLKERYNNHQFVVACCYPDVFWDIPELIITSIDEVRYVAGDNEVDNHNVYKWCIDHNWKGNIASAMWEMYK